MVSRTKTPAKTHIETQMEDIRKDLQELAGLMIPIPKVEISENSDNDESYEVAAARVYRLGILNPHYTIVIYHKDGVFESVEIVAHEMYHIAQEEYRRMDNGPNSDTKYARKISDIMTKLLWESINEAGAYIYGFKSELQKGGLKGKELAGMVLQRIVDWCQNVADCSEITISSSGGEVLDLLFADKSTGSENKKPVEIKYVYEYVTKKVKAILIVAAITLEQNGFDVDKATKYLLQNPFKTIDDILSIGLEKVMESLDRSEEFLAEIKKHQMTECLRG